MTKRSLWAAVAVGLGLAVAGGAWAADDKPAAAPAAQAKPPVKKPGRPGPAARDPHAAGYVEAKELPDGEAPPADADGNFIVGPTHAKAREFTPTKETPRGQTFEFTMKSADSKIYHDGIARDQGTFGTVDPANPAKLDVPTSHPKAWERKVVVYVPKQYVAGTEAPFIVTADGDRSIFPVLDTLIHEKRVPAMVAIAIPSGGGDAQGSQRGLEYDTMSGRYAEFVETEVLPLVEKTAGVKLTKDPDGRATMGCSSGGSAALIMAWYHPEWYHRVLTTSGTFVNQQWPWNAQTPGGAWELHKSLIPNSEAKPLRIYMEVGDRDLLNPNLMRDDMHDWVLANEHTAKALAAKGYHYQFAFVRNAGHCDGAAKSQVIPNALEWVWKGYGGKK